MRILADFNLAVTKIDYKTAKFNSLTDFLAIYMSILDVNDCPGVQNHCHPIITIIWGEIILFMVFLVHIV